MSTSFRTFEEFWPFYLGEHRRRLNRALHYIATSCAILTAIGAIASSRPWLFALVPLIAYGPAWFGHFVIEGNRPATFRYPLWSMRGDLRMLRLALTGKLLAELTRRS